MRSREKEGTAVREGYKIRRDASKFIAVAYLRGGREEGNQRSGGTYMFARSVRIISMARGVGRKDIRMRYGNHLGSASLFQKSVLKLGVRRKCSNIDVQWCCHSSSLLLWLLGGDWRKRSLHHLFATTESTFARNKNVRPCKGSPGSGIRVGNRSISGLEIRERGLRGEVR
jgi:hypothetical protein